MPRNCQCSGVCSPQPVPDPEILETEEGVTRRQFIALASLTAAGAAGVALSAEAAEAKAARATAAEELAVWKQALHQADSPRLYPSDTHADARMHLGGIGTGNFEIGADGQFTTWQLFNTLRDGYVPFFFGVKAGKEKPAKLLQTVGGPEGVARIKRITMQGEYPLATLRYEDADLPVQLSMTAFSPFSPLDTRTSSMPVACFVFKAHNPTKKPLTVSLAAFLQNPVGYDAMGVPISFNSVGFNSVAQRLENKHPNFGGNVNETAYEADARLLLMRSNAGKPLELKAPLHIYTNIPPGSLNTPINDRPALLSIEGLEALPALPPASDVAAPPANRVIWLEDAGLELSAGTLRRLKTAVEAGATLVFSGQAQPLLTQYGQITGGQPLADAAKTRLRPDILFEDFESGYGKWKVEGTAFGMKPVGGTLPNQQAVTGFQGQGVVNSYREGDSTTGRLISRDFTIERAYIRFLIGGGSHRNTQIRLLVDGKVVRAQSGKDNERLEPGMWNVREFEGRTAHIEIVDENTGGWGHINIDEINFSDLSGSVDALEVLETLLPAYFRDVRPGGNGSDSDMTTTFVDMKAYDDARWWEERRFLGRTIGKGKVLLAFGPLLRPQDRELIGARQIAYGSLAGLAGIEVSPGGNGCLPNAPGFGTLALGVLPSPTRGLTAIGTPNVYGWKRGWEDWEQGYLRASENSAYPSNRGETHTGALTATVSIDPGKTVEVPFFLAWHYPNKYNNGGQLVGNHYTTLWSDAHAVAREVAQNFPALRRRTEQFRTVFYDSTLPYWLLDCLTSQLSTIRHVGIVFRLAKGDTYGWEGSNGCCDPTCTHVWGYMANMARLFPELERDMRRIDYKHQQRADGGINNRTAWPSPPHPTGENPFADGHASCVLKAYREAMNYPDDTWLKEYWPYVKKAVDYLIGRDAATNNGRPNGVLEDDQWNTYDEALHGVTTFIGTYYLAALRAGEEWAHRMGDHETGNRYRVVFLDGQNNLIKRCWNGEYFQQDLPDYEKRAGEVGPGCMSDQLIGQWWAHQLGLGYLLPPDKVKSALRAVYKYNFKTDLTGWKHSPRAFAGAKDKGLIICTWPKGGRPANVMLYSDEVWTGIEYQVAAHMMYEGMFEEGLAITKGARDRYDGRPRAPIPRNPWNEIECGGHYARAGSSWTLLLALSGWQYDGATGETHFKPRQTPGNFKSFFSGPEGWGSLKQTRKGKTQKNEIAVVEGKLIVKNLHLDVPAATKSVRMTVGGKAIPATVKPAIEGVVVRWADAVTLASGQTLTVSTG